MVDQITIIINSNSKDNWENCKGTGARPVCKCGSWKAHWECFSRRKWPTKCAKRNCNERAEVGAHIRKNGIAGEWIAPFCKKCNASTGNEDNLFFSIIEGSILVSANRSKTCEI